MLQVQVKKTQCGIFYRNTTYFTSDTVNVLESRNVRCHCCLSSPALSCRSFLSTIIFITLLLGVMSSHPRNRNLDPCKPDRIHDKFRKLYDMIYLFIITSQTFLDPNQPIYYGMSAESQNSLI